MSSGRIVGIQYYRGRPSEEEASTFAPAPATPLQACEARAVVVLPLRQPLVDFLRVPDHAKDSNAIRVDNADGEQVGHLPYDLAAVVCALTTLLKCCCSLR